MLDKNQSCITKDEYLLSYQEDSGITGAGRMWEQKLQVGGR